MNKLVACPIFLKRDFSIKFHLFFIVKMACVDSIMKDDSLPASYRLFFTENMGTWVFEWKEILVLIEARKQMRFCVHESKSWFSKEIFGLFFLIVVKKHTLCTAFCFCILFLHCYENLYNFIFIVKIRVKFEAYLWVMAKITDGIRFG